MGAEVFAKTANDDGVIFFATLKFDDAAVFVQEAADCENTTPAALYFYVEDLDGTYQRALEAGAVSIAEPQQHYHGDRNADCPGQMGKSVVDRNQHRDPV